MKKNAYDYVIVGAGSAGSIVAARLSEDPAVSVLLLEAGPEDKSYWSKVPLGFGKIIFNPAYMWQTESDPEPTLGNRTLSVPHGKVVGGSSSVNGLICVRGTSLDYDTWSEMGAEGWDYKGVLPYFMKYERYAGGDEAYHGRNGPLGVERARWNTPLANAYIESALSLGYARNEDFNGRAQDGFGYWDLTSWNGRRSSVAECYIKPNRDRINLHVVTDATVTRILFDGDTASSVQYLKDGDSHIVNAGREIVLSAGALDTPRLLQLSGIGDATLLEALAIRVVSNLPGVGENLMDHAQTGRSYTTSSRDTFNVAVGTLLGELHTGMSYYLGGHNGPLAIGASLAGGYVTTQAESRAVDAHLHFLPFLPDEKGWDLSKTSGFRLSGYPARSRSRGHVRIVSNDPKVRPSIRFNYFSDPYDMRVLKDVMRLLKRIAEAEPFKAFKVREVEPGPRADDDAYLEQYISQTAATAFHYSGTARMGTDDLAVVDAQLRVRGVNRLRVADASVMPTIVSGNTNAAVLMIGEKAADLIKQSYIGRS